jgi:hypothetical protein
MPNLDWFTLVFPGTLTKLLHVLETFRLIQIQFVREICSNAAYWRSQVAPVTSWSKPGTKVLVIFYKISCLWGWVMLLLAMPLKFRFTGIWNWDSLQFKPRLTLAILENHIHLIYFTRKIIFQNPHLFLGPWKGQFQGFL